MFCVSFLVLLLSCVLNSNMLPLSKPITCNFCQDMKLFSSQAIQHYSTFYKSYKNSNAYVTSPLFVNDLPKPISSIFVVTCNFLSLITTQKFQSNPFHCHNV